MIETRNLRKSYGPALVLDDVSLVLPRGGITTIIGANGAGKSTLLSVIARLVQPDGGSVTVDGTEVFHAAGPELAKKLAVLRQENHLTARLTVRELVGFGRWPHNRGRPTDEDRRAVDHALDYLDLTGLAGRFLDQLSGGQRQRAFVAMVLAQETDYLLLDEPLNNLDMKNARAMMRILREAAHDLGKTVVVVLHDINFASAHSDRIVAMRAGRVLCTGTPGEIVTPERLHQIYDMEIEVREIGGRRFAFWYG
ncbi:iron ABC transporter ATP-binding protein [Pseudogemmobacter humi]|uniref:Putative siderophore transport system ATP-binding protein YusV n=1 Tax=Pseudogemmobacter humi TaxID=2483812 RepID=A0A3P5XRE2_9RHOB|nr:ATP-binding cassette domain-containing protein [Pseudogemmobacter humi]VDC33461.1 putative siderophore transport system ATP-binding protein YusV [Pseudogemmobacter humi]